MPTKALCKGCWACTPPLAAFQTKEDAYAATPLLWRRWFSELRIRCTMRLRCVIYSSITYKMLLIALEKNVDLVWWPHVQGWVMHGFGGSRARFDALNA
eukprot:1156601-Pelagomonas_calceolata.AAC.4